MMILLSSMRVLTLLSAIAYLFMSVSEKRSYIFRLVIAFVAEVRIRQRSAFAVMLQRAFRDIQYPAHVGIVQSAVFSGGNKVALHLPEPFHHMADVVLEFVPGPFFDQQVIHGSFVFSVPRISGMPK